MDYKPTMKLNIPMKFDAIGQLNNARISLGMSKIEKESITFAEIDAYMDEIKENIALKIANLINYPDKEELISILWEKPKTTIDMINFDLKLTRIIAKEVARTEKILDAMQTLIDKYEDFTIGKFISENDTNIYGYLYLRGWILSKKISPKQIFLDILEKNDIESTLLLTPENLDKYIINYFKDNNIKCKSIINGWNKASFIDRKQIFQECIWAITNEKYYIAIPILLIQIEGIIYNKYGRITKDRNKARNKNRKKDEKQEGFWKIKESFDYLFKEKDEWSSWISAILLNDIYSNFGKSYLNSVWESIGYKSDTNRNEILHGININYNKESTLWKIVMILDSIHYII